MLRSGHTGVHVVLRGWTAARAGTCRPGKARARVKVLRVIEAYPLVLTPGRPWHAEVGADAFLRTSRSVCELLTEALVTAGPLRTSVSLLRLGIDEWTGTPGSGPVVVRLTSLPRPPAEGWEGALVRVPPEVAELSTPERRALVLDVVGLVLRSLGPHRGWDPDAVDAVLDLPSQDGGPDGSQGDEALVYRWSSGWKSSPDRRHDARAVYRIADDGFARALIEVRRRRDGEVLLRSKESVGSSTREALQRSAKTLRWEARQHVSLLPPHSPYLVDAAKLVLDLEGPGARAPRLELASPASSVPDVGRSRPPVVREASGENPRGSRWVQEWAMDIEAIGQDSTPVYDWAWNNALAHINDDPAWVAWWSPAKRPTLDVRGWLTWTPGDAVASYAAQEIRVRYPVHPERLSDATREDSIARAAVDLARVMALVSRKLRLGPHPVLPDPPSDAPTTVPDHYTNNRPSEEELRAFASAMWGLQDDEPDDVFDNSDTEDEARDPYVPY